MTDDPGFEFISEMPTLIADIADPAVPRTRTRALTTTNPARERNSHAAASHVDQYLPVSAGDELAPLARLSTPAQPERADGLDAELAASGPARSDAQSPAVPPSTSLLSNFRHRARHRRGMPSPVLKS